MASPPNEREAAFAALSAGVDMEMVSTTYRDHLAALVPTKRVDPGCSTPPCATCCA